MRIRVTTFNIQHGRNHNLPGDVIDLSLMAQNAKETGASVFGFNEVRRGTQQHLPGFPDTPAVLGCSLGGKAIFGKAISLGPGREYGNALISKLPVDSYEIIPIPDPEADARENGWESRCIIKANLDAGGAKLCVMVTHFGLTAPERRLAADTVLNIAQNTAGPMILMGDLNTKPDDPVCGRLSSVFTDAAVQLHREENTFPSDAPRVRIDYIFLKGCTALEVHAVKKIVSDHFALTAEIEVDPC